MMRFPLIVVLFAMMAGPVAAADQVPSPAPSPTAKPAGPCAAPALTSLALRPGIGRAPATSGSVCVAPPGAVILGVGYREQITHGSGRQRLAVFPEPVALVGVADRLEVIVAPGLTYSRRIGTSGDLPPGTGQQDAGFGVQYLVRDRNSVQQAVALVATLPTGYPAGPAGFSSGSPTYSLSYTVAASVSGAFGLSTSQGMLVAPTPNPLGSNVRTVVYQPTINFSYALAPSATLLLEDQITTPTGSHAPTGNRALAAFVQTLSPNVVLDVELEINLLPPPGLSQHAIGGGVTVRL